MLKRFFDILISLLGLSFLLPLFVVVSVLILFDDGAPVFFKQVRVGRRGKAFKILKFRTMKSSNQGSEITVSGDHRITRIGAVLRRLKVDELPQLINVFLGEMSFVGPRPEVQKYVNLYSLPQQKIFDFRPGITDPASIAYRNESEILSSFDDHEKAYIEKILPDKLRLSLQYQDRANLYTDFLVILDTVFKTSWHKAYLSH